LQLLVACAVQLNQMFITVNIFGGAWIRIFERRGVLVGAGGLLATTLASLLLRRKRIGGRLTYDGLSGECISSASLPQTL
jgi:hypothetical protein